jgi:hypothetical protein
MLQKTTELNEKDALLRFQPDSIITTSFKNKKKVHNMIHPLVGVSIEIIKVGLDYVLNIMKSESYGTLEGFSGIFKDERHFLVCKSTQDK